ncbi:flagellar biosynthesis anti-sigma factor FlgM [Sphingomonas aliaeris]|uniref:Negative regulator of flagellin synthesis n=1 Tax=Sphingomonas aliaeris TaxID=2759526 RepID=A0A974NU55_9SPHN|nr:flagellar biosynthesis anti-sigma factor FlgM [Sphingomonas aliaeris]QQV77009.1 flagellar biosynthesis anti-sigma factor FlgM [Sphingomonas aliaeris]
MVDPLGVKPVQTGERIAPVARVVPTATVAPTVEQDADRGAVKATTVKQSGGEQSTVEKSTVASTAKDFASSPPIDLERIAKIRKAIADGNFPIYPSTIADRLIASKYDWLRNDGE